MDSRPLREYCSEVERTDLTLLQIDADAAAHERWLRDTPEWWLESAEVVRSNEDFEKEFPERVLAEVRNTSNNDKKVVEEQRVVLKTSDDVIAAMKRAPCMLQAKYLRDENSDIVWDELDGVAFPARRNFSAARSVVFAAVGQEPTLVLEHADESLVLDVLKKFPDMGQLLSKNVFLSEIRCNHLLHAALEQDPALRDEFVQTARPKEINVYKWNVEEREKSSKAARRRRFLQQTGRQVAAEMQLSKAQDPPTQSLEPPCANNCATAEAKRAGRAERKKHGKKDTRLR